MSSLEQKTSRLDAFVNTFSKETIDADSIKTALEDTHHILQFGTDRNLCLHSLCLISEFKPSDPLIISLLEECYAASRIFHYGEMQKRINENYDPQGSLVNGFAKSIYTLNSGTTLTKEQFDLYTKILGKKRVVVSAPTSFGKSRIIKELLLNAKFNNVAIVIPTLALLTETFLSIRSDENLSHINILTNTKQDLAESNNVIVFTPERMNTYLDLHKELYFDFFVMDEVYKIYNDNDERSHVFTDCLYRMKDRSESFYLIGPYFDKFSERFLEKTNSYFIPYKTNIVQQQVYDINELKVGDEFHFDGGDITKRTEPKINLKNLLKKLKDQSLIYTHRKDTCESRSRYVAKHLPQSEATWCEELIEYISDNISSKWSLIGLLKKGCGFHHAGIPKFIQIEIVDAFNNGLIKNLFCTTTLIEGVNTSAKNVIITSHMKGTQPLTGFDVKNIKGRAGRFGQHFIGNIFLLDKVPEDSNLPCIEFSYYDNNLLSPEQNISIKKKDLSSEQKKQREQIINELKKEDIPLQIIKKSKFVSIERQLNLAKALKSKSLQRRIHFTGNLPTKKQLDEILGLIIDNLFNESEQNDRSFSKSKLQYFTKFYVYKTPTTKELIKNWTDSTNPDTKIRNIFKLVTRYFEFALPKYLSTFEILYNHLSNKSISLTYLITLLEFGYADEHCIALKEAGVPPTLISKIKDNFKGCKDIYQIRRRINLRPGTLSSLSDFERTMLHRYV